LQVKTPRRRLRKRAIEPGEISVASKWGYTYTAGWSPSATQHEIKDVDTTQLDGAFAHRVFDDSLSPAATSRPAVSGGSEVAGHE
jgi:hypothetical protein